MFSVLVCFLTQDTHDSNNAVMSSTVDVSFLNKEHLVVEGSSSQQDDESPHSFAMDLVHSDFEKDDERHIIKDDIVGYIIADILWQNY